MSKLTPEEEYYVKWCQSMVDHLNDGAQWTIPRSGLTFIIDKVGKRLMLISGNDPEEFELNKFWFGKIGWKVEHSFSKN